MKTIFVTIDGGGGGRPQQEVLFSRKVFLYTALSVYRSAKVGPLGATYICWPTSLSNSYSIDDVIIVTNNCHCEKIMFSLHGVVLLD